MDVLIYRHECRVPNSVCWPPRQGPGSMSTTEPANQPSREGPRIRTPEYEEEDHMARTLCPSEREVNIAKAYRQRELCLSSLSLSSSRISSRLSFRSSRLTSETNCDYNTRAMSHVWCRRPSSS